MFTVILHDAPYTTERSGNGFRFAEKALDNGTPVCVFRLYDAVYVARKGQCPPDGTPNLEYLLIKLVGKGVTVSVYHMRRGQTVSAIRSAGSLFLPHESKWAGCWRPGRRCEDGHHDRARELVSRQPARRQLLKMKKQREASW